MQSTQHYIDNERNFISNIGQKQSTEVIEFKTSILPMVEQVEIDAMTKMSHIMEYQNRPHTEVRKAITTNAEGETIYGPKTTSITREINMCMHWTSNPDDEVDPAFVSLTAD